MQNNADIKANSRKPRAGLKLAAVLVVIFERAGILHVILTTRAKGLRTHVGQTSLPGGKMDEDDEDVIETAVNLSRFISWFISDFEELAS
jgi:coenzyme A diphosphatase NUDT7